MPYSVFNKACRWIWSREVSRPYNRFVCFRKTFETKTLVHAARLRITADSRYEVYLNGEWLGHGPPRSWMSPWPVDEYDLTGLLRPGCNTLATLVHHFGVGTFQYLHAAPGLLAEVEWVEGRRTRRTVTDSTWKAVPHPGFGWPVPRISCQQGWEEQFDARQAPGGVPHRRAVSKSGAVLGATPLEWREPDFDDASWPAAVVIRRAGDPPHNTLELRDIPFLTRDPVHPVRVIAVESVRPSRYTWSLLTRDLIAPSDKSANRFCARLFVATHIYSDHAQRIDLHQPHANWGHPGTEWKLNGALLEFTDRATCLTDSGVAHSRLKKGWNTLLGKLPLRSHRDHVVVNIDTPHAVRFLATPETKKGAAAAAQPPWLALGPFAVTAKELEAGRWMTEIVAESIHPEATVERFEALWRRGALDGDDLQAPFVRPFPPEMIAPVDAFARCASDRRQPAAPRVNQPDALLFDTADWTIVHPPTTKTDPPDVRFLLDFGDEVIGFQEFELDAPEGTILDVHNFEFIQRDGRFNLAEGMNNSFRYICREGIQRYRTFVRRGFRYSFLTLRHFARPVRIRFVRTLMSTYPVAQWGDFACSDPMLERIWHVGAHTVRCCSEDTYTDCPTYEQTHWVGDGRNEAMVDLVVNGDPRLSRHCWIQAARSLDRSPLVESHVPSGWPVILPAWTFLWMRWAREHYLFTGDKPLAREMLSWLQRNIAGMELYIGSDGLFRIAAWNMFDWAAMDTPHDESAVTHQNCLAVLGLRDAADLARALGRGSLARRWDGLADKIARAVNRHLWSDRKQAYFDCVRPDGTPSAVFSQQTQTAAYISGVAKGKRATRCRDIIRKPPRGFVTSGSPFFMFFVLEGLVREGRDRELVETIRSYWGRQIDAGATSIWEMMHTDAERMTRSHCHGWSAAPTYFLSAHVLGIQPLEPGYAKIHIAPRPGGLTWAHGKVPTPRGTVECHWENDARTRRFTLRAVVPPNTPARIELPFTGKLEIEVGRVRRLASSKGNIRLETSSLEIVLVLNRNL